MRGVRNIQIRLSVPGTLLRIVFAILFGVTRFLLGREAYVHVISLHVASERLQTVFVILAPVAGALIGVLVAPLARTFFEDELVAVEAAIERLSPAELAGGAAGLIAGLVIAFLIKNILFEFIFVAGPAASYLAILLYIIVSLFAAYLGARVGAKMRIVPLSSASVGARGVPKVIDTSVIVDGRVAEIVGSGFLEGPLVLPRFVLRELQSIADSTDPLKRTRGRRGLDVLNRLQELALLEISEVDYDDIRANAVDAKLVRLAQDLGAKLLTNDYNLNRVAHVENVDVLNINELANAVKPVVLPGEDMHVQVVREGKEMNQGVGYLDDGTMVVVENSRRLIGEPADVVVTSVLQTPAGRMIFGRIEPRNPTPPPPTHPGSAG